MVAQAQTADLWGYQRIDNARPGKVFVTTEHICDWSGGEMESVTFAVFKEKGMVAREKFCEFKDSVQLMTVATYGEAWPRSKIHIYQRINENDIFSLAKIADGPKTLNVCDGDFSQQTLDPSIGESVLISSPRRHIIAASKDYAVAIEASGERYGRWAYLLSRESENGSKRSYCKPNRIIRADTILRASSSITSQANKQKISELCATTTAQACGTIDDMIATYGGAVLVQGPEVVLLPRGESTYGAMLTVLGQKGLSTLTVLRTEPSGLTRVLSVMR